MLRRCHAPALRGLLRRFPAVTILGPRQCGKTTFIRQVLPGWTYVDLERPRDLAPLAADPEARLEQLGDRVILDEAQSLPELFPVLRGVIDRARARRGRYVLLGSASPSLVRGIAESLAGRTGFLDLPPFRWEEVVGSGIETLETLWLRGGFPDAALQTRDRARLDWMEAYTRSILERDLPALGIEVSAVQLRKLWTMLAHVNGGLWNASQLAASLGLSYHTVNRHVDVLEQAFLIRRLTPYHVNIGKRLVKSPKVYFRDTGLLHYFLGIADASTLRTHPARGASFEAFVIDQMISLYERHAPGSQAFFWRTASGQEVDLLVDLGPRRVPFEVKLSSSPGADDARGLRACMGDLGLARGYLIYPGPEDYSLGGGVVALSGEKVLRTGRAGLLRL
jgi:predicted AAA+ superfamily ATPase